MKTSAGRHLVGSVGSVINQGLRMVAKTLFAAGDFPYRQYGGPRMLIYHQIGAGLGRQMEVTLEAFEAHLSWLAQNATVVDLDTALEHRPEAANQRLVVLTFDDGYEDLFRLGYPLLRAHRFPFLLYLTTEPIETGRSLGPPRARPLTWDQVREMVGEGLMTVGAHTHRHPNLRFLNGGEIAEELGTSNALIQTRIGQTPRHFAYPYGHWSPQVDKEVRTMYSTAALGGGRPNSGNTDPYLLHRVPIQLSDGVFFFRRKLKTGLRWEEPVRRLVQRYRGP